jgi:hypothetical protein
VATWSGWIIQLLNRANLLNTPPNQTFMSEWAKHAPTSCHNNPVDLSHAVAGSSRCGDTVAGFGRSQSYGTHAEAAHAFALQIGTDWVKPLRDAINSGNPFQIADRAPVVAVLKRWGSVSFADWYATAQAGGSGSGGGGGGSRASHTHKGWTDVRRSTNQRWPAALRKAHKLNRAALRSLGRVHKVP